MIPTSCNGADALSDGDYHEAEDIEDERDGIGYRSRSDIGQLSDERLAYTSYRPSNQRQVNSSVQTTKKTEANCDASTNQQLQ